MVKAFDTHLNVTKEFFCPKLLFYLGWGHIWRPPAISTEQWTIFLEPWDIWWNKGHDLALGLNRAICLGKSWSWSALALVWWTCWNVHLWKNTFFCDFSVPYRRWILSLTLKSLQSRTQFHFISWHWQDYELCMYLVTILTEVCSDDHGCMSRILSYLVFAWSTVINCDQPRSTWAIWRRNPLWSARVAPCMWTLREVGIERGGYSRQHCRLNIWRYIGWVDKYSIRSQDPIAPLNVDQARGWHQTWEDEDWGILRETVCSTVWLAAKELNW